MTTAEDQTIWTLSVFTELRCLRCGSAIAKAELLTKAGYPELGLDKKVARTPCDRHYPIVDGTPRMLADDASDELARHHPCAATGRGLSGQDEGRRR